MNPASPGSRPESSQGPQTPAWPDWKLERYLLGELPPAEARRLEADREGDAALARRIQSLHAEHQGLRAAHPSGPMAAGIARRLRAGEIRGIPAAPAAPAAAPAGRAPRFAWPRLPAPAWAPALAMLLVLAVLPFTPYSPFRPTDGTGETGAEAAGGERLKGLKPRLLLHRKASEGSVRLSDGERVRSGDLIQIQYESAGRLQGALFSLDAEGQVTRHLPERGDRSAALASGAAGKAGGPVALDFAYELDDAEGWERFYLIVSDRPFGLPAVEAALRGLRAAGPGSADTLALPPHLEQTTFILLKEPGT